MGTLFLPALKQKKFHTITDVTLEEATQFITNFTAAIKAGHKIKDTGNAVSEPILFNGIIDADFGFEIEDAEAVADVLKLADTPGTRGARAVFVDEEGNFALGTTVSYNQNWATIGFDDDTVLDKLRAANFALTVDNQPANPADDSNDYSWNDSGCSDTDWHGSSC